MVAYLPWAQEVASSILAFQTMTTLIAAYNSNGCVGRCDAKCYLAQHPECDCICGGKNHGVGLKMATDNTRELAEKWIKDWKLIYPETEKFEVPAQQLGLEIEGA